jgi:hypothetical protein
LLAIANSIVAKRLFPVAVEVISPAFATLVGITSDEPVLLVRFAGNEVGVKYQIEQVRGEVIADDEQLWRSIAAVPLRYKDGTRASVLPSRLAAFCKERLAGNVWQIGAADGRIRMLDNTSQNNHRPLDPLMQRVKHQLDPSNLFKVQP